MGELKKSRLLRQLIYLTSGLILLTVVVPGLFAHLYVVPTTAEKRYFQTMAGDVEYLATSLERKFAKSLQAVEYLAGLGEFSDMHDLDRAVEVLKIFLQGNAVFTGALITDAGGELKLIYSNTTGRDFFTGEHNLMHQDYVKIPLAKGIPYISDVILISGNQLPVVFISSPILVAGNVTGVLSLSINLGNEDNVFYNLFQDFTKNKIGQIYVLDRGGTLIYHRQKELVGTRLENEATIAFSQGETGLLEDDATGKEKIVVFSEQINPAKWGIVYELGYGEIYQMTTLTRNVAAGTLVVMLVLGITISAILAGIILKPLRILISATEQVAAGSLEQKIEVKGHHDFQKLIANFNLMIDNLRGKHEQLEKLILEDYLTGLANRRYFEQHLLLELERAHRMEHESVVLMVDIDNFKQINDRFGHLEGDRVLKHLASVLRNNLREVDLPARFGGEEFVVILPVTTLRQGLVVAQKLCAEVSEGHLPSRRGQISFTVSIGVAGTGQMAVTEELDYHQQGLAILRKADEAMYAAKSSGKNKAVAC